MEKHADNIRKMMNERNGSSENSQGSHLKYNPDTKTFDLSSGSSPGIKATKGDVTFGC